MSYRRTVGRTARHPEDPSNWEDPSKTWSEAKQRGAEACAWSPEEARDRGRSGPKQAERAPSDCALYDRALSDRTPSDRVPPDHEHSAPKHSDHGYSDHIHLEHDPSSPKQSDPALSEPAPSESTLSAPESEVEHSALEHFGNALPCRESDPEHSKNVSSDHVLSNFKHSAHALSAHKHLAHSPSTQDLAYAKHPNSKRTLSRETPHATRRREAPKAGQRIFASFILLALLHLSCSCDSSPALTQLYGHLSPSENSLSFGATTLGMAVERQLFLQQQGRVPARLESLRVEPDEGVFAWGSLPDSLPPQSSEKLKVKYHPTQPGVHRAQLVVTFQNAEEVRIELEGRGVDARADFDQQVDFGRPALGTQRGRQLLLRNSEETPVPVRLKIRGRDASEFAVTSTLTLPANGESWANLSYLPQGWAGKREVSLEIVPCPLCPPQKVELLADAVENALGFEPSPLSFGGVSVDSRRRAPLRVVNYTDEAIELSSLVLSESSAPGFALHAPDFPRSLAGDSSLEVELSFSPTHLGAASGELELRANAQSGLWKLPISANGGGAQLVVSPQFIDFRSVPTGGRWVLPVTLANGASDTASAPLRIEDLQLSSPNFSLEHVPQLPIELAAQERIELRLVFHPIAEGPAEAELFVFSNDPLSPAQAVNLIGTGLPPVECELTLRPEALHFGALAPGYGAILGIRIENAGQAQCSLWDGRLSGDPAFALQRERSFARLLPGDALMIPVTFRPMSSARFEALFEMESSSHALPHIRVPISGGGRDTCLVPEPRYLEFGQQRLDCGPAEATVAFRNVCSAEIELQDLWLGTGSDEETFHLLAGAALPSHLAPGEVFSAAVRYEPGPLGSSYQPLFALGDDSDLPTLLPLAGETLRDARHEEHFVQPEASKLDLLWVIDNTASMRDERRALQLGIAHFLQQADAMKVDYHMGVTTTGLDPAPEANDTGECPGGVNGGEAGRLFPVDHSRPRIIDPTQPDRAEILAANLDVGGCHSVEQGLLAAQLALSPPLVDNASHPRSAEENDGNLGLVRRDAALAVVVVSDEDDQSPGSVDELVQRLRAVKPSSPLSFHAIVAPPAGCDSAVEPGLRYLEAVDRIGGSTSSICEANFEPLLSTLAQQLFSPRQRFVLQAPAQPSSLEVKLNGNPASGWHYDANSNSVLFSNAPPPGSDIHIRYQEPCGVP